LTTPSASYCVGYVKATRGALGGDCIQHREDLGNGKSRSGNHRHERTTNQEGSQNGRPTKHHQYTCTSYYIIDLVAHVENGSQVTLPRKRLHHEFMHDLKYQMNVLASEYEALRGGLRYRQSDLACWHSGLDRRYGSPWRKCLEIIYKSQAPHR
jgi:hypothetical protein